MGRTKAIIATICILALAASARAGELHVPGDYNTIQAAIDAAVDGDEIIVADGIYTGEGNRDIVVAKAITIRSESGPQNCTIECEEAGRAFSIYGTESIGTIIRGFTIINGYAASGAGIYCERSSPIIENCRFINCSAGDGSPAYGGGLHFYNNCDPTIKNCIFIGNFSYRGGAIGSREYVDLEIINCLFADNQATGYGGGISCYSNCSAYVLNSTFANNSAGSGGAMHNATNNNLTVVNSILWGNLPNQIWVFGSAPVTYSNLQGGYTGQGNIDQDPLFAAPDDYHLVFGSPCVDTGTNSPPGGLPEYDLDFSPRPLDGDLNDIAIADMGAYELFSDPNKTFLAVSPAWFEFYSSTSEPNPPSQILSIWKVGAGVLNWQITEDCNWLEITPMAGQSSGEVDEVTVDVNSKGLSFGQYYTTMTVFDPCDSNNIRLIPVTLKVNPKIHVPTDFPTIQAAIDAAFDGCEIIVADGTYTGTGNRDIDFKGKEITVRSENGPKNCIIDCNGTAQDNHRGFYFHSGENANSILHGFTIKNGYYYYGSLAIGGGISSINQGTKPTIRNCIITDNEASHGGGIGCYRSNPRIMNCIISKNSAGSHRGGGIYCDYGSPNITGCTIADNSAAYGGGAVYTHYSHPKISNSIIWNNSSSSGQDEIDPGSHGSVTISYSDVKGGWEGSGNIDTDPCFVEAGYWDVNDVWVDGDYRLLETSPCIDAGDPNYVAEPNETDLDGSPRVIDGDEDGVAVVDMGAYEFWPSVEAEMKLTPQTLNCASKGKFIKAHITLPEGIFPEDIDVNTPAIAEPMDIDSEYIKVVGSNTDPVRLEIAFDRRAFCEDLTETGEIDVAVFGYLATGQEFYGTDTIRIVGPERKRVLRRRVRR